METASFPPVAERSPPPLFRASQPSANPHGRPLKAIPRHAITIVEALAAHRVCEAIIARSLGMSPATFRQRKRENDAIRNALERGRLRRTNGSKRAPRARARTG